MANSQSHHLSRAEFIRTGLPGLLAVTLVGCAVATLPTNRALAGTLPKYRDLAAQIPAVQPGYARVYVYCIQQTTVMRPNNFLILIDGLKQKPDIGTYNCFYIDHVVGECKVGARDMSGFQILRSLTLHLKEGETRYVQAAISDDTVFLEPRLIIVDHDQALQDLASCYYVGHNLAQAPA